MGSKFAQLEWQNEIPLFQRGCSPRRSLRAHVFSKTEHVLRESKDKAFHYEKLEIP